MCHISMRVMEGVAAADVPHVLYSWLAACSALRGHEREGSGILRRCMSMRMNSHNKLQRLHRYLEGHHVTALACVTLFEYAVVRPYTTGL